MTNQEHTILVVDDDRYAAHHLRDILVHEGYRVIIAQDLRTVSGIIGDRNQEIHAVLLDLVMSSGATVETGHYGDSLRLVEEISRVRPDVPVIVYSSYLTEMENALPAMGAYAFVSKRSSPVEIRHLLKRAIADYEIRNREGAEQSRLAAHVKELLLEQISKYAPIKERTLQIPDEGGYELIKPLIGFKAEIERKLAKYPFQQNVFLMMKFRNGNRDLGEYIVENLAKEGLRGIRADHDEWNLTANVYNPIAVLYCCKYGIALFDEPEEHQAYSPNVAYELGMMHYQNKTCLILRHSCLPTMPFDLIKDLYVTYTKELEVRKLVKTWIKQVAAR